MKRAIYIAQQDIGLMGHHIQVGVNKSIDIDNYNSTLYRQIIYYFNVTLKTSYAKTYLTFTEKHLVSNSLHPALRKTLPPLEHIEQQLHSHQKIEPILIEIDYLLGLFTLTVFKYFQNDVF